MVTLCKNRNSFIITCLQMTSLAHQLKRLALPQNDSNLLSRREVASVLFDPKDAATMDRSTFYALGEFCDLPELFLVFSPRHTALLNSCTMFIDVQLLHMIHLNQRRCTNVSANNRYRTIKSNYFYYWQLILCVNKISLVLNLRKVKF